jgi:hypothetical protein
LDERAASRGPLTVAAAPQMHPSVVTVPLTVV